MKRAAAKIQLNLNAVVEGYTVGTPMFRMVNYNTSTSILEKGSEGHVSVTEMEHYVGNSNSFNGEDGLYWNQFVAYSYSFSWAGDMEQRPCILVKLPLTKNGESETYQRDKTEHDTKKAYSDYNGSYRAMIYVPKSNDGTTEMSYLIDEGVYSSGYWWESPKENPPYTAKASGTSQNSNPNMYVIQITSTNGDYVIGHPKIVYSNPNSSSYGSKDHVVSPAFMIASQLGAVMSDGFDKRTAITHCKTYREVAKDGTVYDNWRLPTNEEVKVICKYQYDSNSPIVRCSAASTCLLEQERVKMKHYLYCAGHSHIDAHR